MVSPWIVRLLVLAWIQFIGCNNQLSKNKQPVASEASKTGTTLKTPTCPEGTAFVKGLGVCGVPVGDDIYEIDYGWWTGKSAGRFKQADATERLVAIKIINNSPDTVFLKANYEKMALFEISAPESAQKMVLPENYFCPNWCPDKGMPMELDCGRPRDMVIALATGQSTVSRWSGMEIIDVTRYSSDAGSKNCVKKGQTLSGNYEIKVCAYKDYNPTNPKEQGETQLRSGLPKGNANCISTTLQFPKESTIEVVIE